MAEIIEWFEGGDLDAHVFRIVQSLVLARKGLMSAEFGSVEEYLGQHTSEYYAALNDAHGPTYEPQRDALDLVARTGPDTRLRLGSRRRRRVPTSGA